jgi:hypothetical protein
MIRPGEQWRQCWFVGLSSTHLTSVGTSVQRKLVSWAIRKSWFRRSPRPVPSASPYPPPPLDRIHLLYSIHPIHPRWPRTSAVTVEAMGCPQTRNGMIIVCSKFNLYYAANPHLQYHPTFSSCLLGIRKHASRRYRANHENNVILNDIDKRFFFQKKNKTNLFCFEGPRPLTAVGHWAWREEKERKYSTE